jgi:hypothetical protein
VIYTQLARSPRSLAGAHYGEIVGELRSGRNRALRNLTGTVHLGGPVHEKAVEMEGGALVAELIIDIDDDLVANGGGHDGQWPLAVDANGWPLEHAIWVGSDPGDVEVVGDGRCFCDDKQEKQHR